MSFEFIVLSCLTGTIWFVAMLGLWSRSRGLTIGHPLLWVGLFFLYYFVLGPLSFFTFKEDALWVSDYASWADNGAMLGATASAMILFGACCGHSFKIIAPSHLGQPSVTPNAAIRAIALAWYVAGLTAVGIFFLAVPLDDRVARGAGGFGILFNCVNWLIAATLLYTAFSRNTWTIVTIVTLTLVIVTFMGIRFRIVLFLAGVLIILVLQRRVSLTLPRMVLGVSTIALLMGLLALGRTYRAGVDIEAYEEVTLESVVSRALDESSTFFVLSEVVRHVDQDEGYRPLHFVSYLFVLPIPRSIWPDKPLPEFQGVISAALGGAGHDAMALGAMMPMIGEWYLAGGVIGVIACSFIFGLLASWISRNYRTVTPGVGTVWLSLLSPFLFYALSRGYLAQVAIDLLYLSLPPITALHVLKKRSANYQNELNHHG